MAINPKDSKARNLIGKFGRTLLATTCLTVASGGAALAGTITYTEGLGGLPADFPNTFPGTPLAAATLPGTTTVNGFVNGEDSLDYFELTGLGTGTFTLTATEISEFGEAAVVVETDAASVLAGPLDFDQGENATVSSMAIPVDGNLVIEIENQFESSGNYSVTVNTTGSTVPEPSTLIPVGLGLAGALTLSRKRRKQ
jgi:hypothetical protein